MIGEYSVQLSKTGYANVFKTITVSEGKSGEINETLINGRAVTVNSTPSGVTLFIDGASVGKTPYNGNLTFGNHVLRIENDGKEMEKTVSVMQAGGENDFVLSFGPRSFTETVNGVRFDMVAVKGGSFMMGNENGESDEKPIHSVTLSDFSMSKTEVTQALYKVVMNSNPSRFIGVNNPVEKVSWNDCQEFIRKLNNLTNKTYRLPTEAEWEYAARGGNKNNKCVYAGSYTVGNVAWFIDNSNKTTHEVASKEANDLGLYDMSGNVMEWCSDLFSNYTDNNQINPTLDKKGEYRINRGGSWNRNAKDSRTTDRDFDSPYNRREYIGIRLVLSSK